MNETNSLDFNRRDFLKGGSAATLMTMMGGVRVFAQDQAKPTAAPTSGGLKIKIGVIGLGAWGREIINNLTKMKEPVVAAICDSYPAFLRRAGNLAPGATPTEDYKTILDNKDIEAVIISTATHQHKDIAVAALKAGKHVYCEAPLANTLEDAREIALAAKAVGTTQIFQAGFQYRSDPERLFLLPFIRSGALGPCALARAQWHKKQSWRVTSPSPAREKALNWRLHKETSLGLIGEIGSHQIDTIGWFLNAKPVAITGFGSLMVWNKDMGDDRDVPDTIQAVIEYPGGTRLIYDATLANSFDGMYEVLYGSDAAVMLRPGRQSTASGQSDTNAWMFKEVDSRLLGWEVFAKKETFYKETGIALKAGATKSAQGSDELSEEDLLKVSPVNVALKNFVLNSIDLREAIKNAALVFPDDAEAAAKEAAEKLATLRATRPTCGYLDGYEATVTAIKANEAVMSGARLQINPEWYNLK